MAEKTVKMFAKRLKVTGSGKILARQPGINHFNAKQSRTKQLGKKKLVSFKISNKRRARFLPHH